MRRHGETAHRAGLHLRQAVGHVGEGKIDVAGNYCGGRLPAALERDVHRRSPGARFEQLDRVVGQAAGAARTIVELLGIGLRIGHELGHRLDRKLLLDDDHLRTVA